jgi:hypothetical protein
MKTTIKRWALIFTFATLLLSPVELAVLAQQHRPFTPAPAKSTQPAVDNTTQPSTTKSQSDEASDPVNLTNVNHLFSSLSSYQKTHSTEFIALREVPDMAIYQTGCVKLTIILPRQCITY